MGRIADLLRKSRAAKYRDAINRAAMTLIAMSVKPSLKPSVVAEVVAAVELRGGRLDADNLLKFDLHAVLDEVADRATLILSAAMRERLPGIADEVDAALGAQLRFLVAETTQLAAV